MEIKLYTTNSDPHELNKVLTEVGTFECKLKAPVDKENIEITLGTGNVSANYAYVAAFGRYYDIKPITQNNAICIFSGQSDPLMSFKAQILVAPAVVARNPWKYDKYVPDSKLPIESRTARGILPFPNTGIFNGNQNTYILTTIGSGSPVTP